ncbi:ABC transporter releated protein [Methanocaldococcus vulcanius M7]|uniref:ABC transporter releated protein n=1 Tax=Methanocaldococcus vulcanius (strain ATCC 700851 / DSM 12094 / M7) TaxID=579137 RepID=C9RGB3_METVM|nr:ABC transporter ATP-binding protein [Methanocaldococcus vulcanius]ACX72615.1 ABC transporter releated protein [Methanocaldococcus vulcanius M7]
MLKAENLSVGYGNYVVVEGINLEINRGEILCIIGPNGAGKSTLLKTIATYLKPKKGVVYLNGKKIHDLKPKDLAKEMAVVLTERVNPGNMTGFDVVAIGRHPYTDLFGRLTERDKEIIIESARAVNAEYLLEKNFFEMSDGERQKIMIARALAQEPKVLILDEPTSFLDAKHKIELTLLLRKLADEKNLAIVVTLHDIELALRIADKMALIKNHKVIAYGYPENVMKREIVNELYDLKNANYSEVIGYFELKSNPIKNKKIFVICGGGTGANVLRYLVKNRYEVVVGILHKNDADYFIAEAMGVKIIEEEAYNKISKEKFEEALKELKNSDVVVYTDFPIGEMNELNLKLIEEAKNLKKRIIFYREDISVLKGV